MDYSLHLPEPREQRAKLDHEKKFPNLHLNAEAGPRQISCRSEFQTSEKWLWEIFICDTDHWIGVGGNLKVNFGDLFLLLQLSLGLSA